MKVTLLASTVIEMSKHDEGEAATTEWLGYDDYESPSSADFLAEFAGRACYQSFDRPNPATRSNADYLANIIQQQHFSVLEHASATFLIEGVSRSLTHELIRHRHLSFSQLSQRYVNEDDAEMVYPPAIDQHDTDSYVLHSVWTKALSAYDELAQELLDRGLTRKQAREAARCVLPNMTETKIVCTGNMRAWREFVQKRNSPHADAEIQRLAAEILRQLKRIAPNSFSDM